MGTTSDLRAGAILKFNGQNCQVMEFEHRTPGKGQACYQVKMRNLNTGKINENRYRSGESIEFVRVERHSFQYLYNDGEAYYFMNKETYDQIPMQADAIGDMARFMKENQDVDMMFEGDTVLSMELPSHVHLEVTYAEPGVRGDTATNVTKPATLETGAEINVPIFINEGDKIVVDTRTGSYVERVKG